MNEATSDIEASKACRKTRRAHTKSRYGCTKCKQRRIKCDELMPRCSRCTKMNLICQYRRPKECWDEIDSGMGSTDAESPPSLTPSGGSAYGLSLDSSALLQSPAALSLAPAEFELLKHYLEHTSVDATVDEEEQYTLQMGIPALACQSKPLMSSVLALAAVCKCHDIITQPAVNIHEARNQVLQLLSVASEYHAESLHEIQGALHETEKYDHILANAAMMGMYGSGSHCARIWLAKTAGHSEVAPGCPQWISLFRAARLAFAGLVYDDTDCTSEADHAFPPRQYGHHVLEPSSPANHHPLGPIVAATVGSALARLHQHVEAVLATEAPNEDAQACFAAFSILSDIVAATFPAANPNPNPPLTLHHPRHPTSSPDLNNTPIDPELLSPGTWPVPGPVPSPGTSHSRSRSHSQTRTRTRLAQVSPWLRRYTARIASMAPSRLPRRTIMAFVHKVPGRYLSLLEEVLTTTTATRGTGGDAMDLTGESYGYEGLGRDTAGGDEGRGQGQPSIAVRHFALEIFAHWLVLVLLLDDVWWIGGIGAWELGRVVAMRREGFWQSCLGEREGEGDWWPGSMWEVSQLREKYK